MQVNLDCTLSCYVYRPITLFWLAFASGNVLLFCFQSYAPANSPVDLGLVILNSTRYSVCNGIPGSAWLVAPFISFFLFCVKLSREVYWYCLRGNVFPIFSL